MPRSRPARIPEPEPLLIGQDPGERVDYATWMKDVTKRSRRLRAHREILDAADQVVSRKQLDRLRACGEVWVEVERVTPQGESSTVWRQLNCNSRYCPICASRESYRRAEELKGRFSRHASSGVSLLATITVGRPVPKTGLPQRYRDLKAVWKVLWPILKKNGCRGGDYSYEGTASPSDPELTHLHMHVWLDWDAGSDFIVNDTNWIMRRQRSLTFHDFTPAWLQWMAWVEQAMEKATPRLWERLRPTEECWAKKGRYASARRTAATGRVECPRRFVSVDLGGRFPGRPGTKARKAGNWIPLLIVDSGPKEALKYLLKGMQGEAVVGMMRLFKGRRRSQPFGIYARADHSADKDRELLELGDDETGFKRLTGRLWAMVDGSGRSFAMAEDLGEEWQRWGMRKRAGLAREPSLHLVYAAPWYAIWAWVDEDGERIHIPFKSA